MKVLLLFAAVLACGFCEVVREDKGEFGEVVYETLKKDDLIQVMKVEEVETFAETFLAGGKAKPFVPARNRRTTRTMHDCPDTAGIRVNGYTCGQYFALVGSKGCAVDGLKLHCCGTRRMYCETCSRDSPDVKLNDKTCKEILTDMGTNICDHHLIIQHCCASRAQFCPCNADVDGTQFYHPEAGSTPPTCSNIFTLGKLEDQCKHPNLWEKCCKTRMNFCSAPPSVIGR